MFFFRNKSVARAVRSLDRAIVNLDKVADRNANRAMSLREAAIVCDESATRCESEAKKAMKIAENLKNLIT